MNDKKGCDIMNVLDELRNLFRGDFAAEENEDNGVSYTVVVKSSAKEVSSHD